MRDKNELPQVKPHQFSILSIPAWQNNDNHASAEGKVFLVGAGPGDAGLITWRGVECLRQADAVLFDYLVNPAILRHAKPQAELVCLGRHRREEGGASDTVAKSLDKNRIWKQTEINERLVQLAQAGRKVVRLKGGDPAVFGRLAEEMEALEAAGIEYEIVPGVTAGLAASSFAGIRITQREAASAVALVTGHEGDSERPPELDYAALAAFPGTLVFYMGVTTAREWTTALIAAGKSAETPAAIVRRCSWPDQVTIRCTLGTVVEQLESARMRPPVVIIVGEVIGFSASTQSWFTRRPLFGKRILLTRPIDRTDALWQPLTELGAECLVQPAIEISPPDDWQPVDRAISRLAEFDWLVFSSVNGVQYLLRSFAGNWRRFATSGRREVGSNRSRHFGGVGKISFAGRWSAAGGLSRRSAGRIAGKGCARESGFCSPGPAGAAKFWPTLCRKPAAKWSRSWSTAAPM